MSDPAPDRPRPRVYLALGRPSRVVLEATRDRRVLESFAYMRPASDRYRPLWRSGMLDSGAFTEMTQGTPIDLGAYIEFCRRKQRFYDVVAALDDIRGDVDKSRANFVRMLDAGLRPMPVFHQGEPWSVLEEWVAAAPERYVGLGFQRPIREAERFLDESFGRIPPGVRVHGFAMTSFLAAGRWPFYSVDSSTWVYEWRALLGVRGQGADALAYLTPSELLEIVFKKYDRIAARHAFGPLGSDAAVEDDA